jgi:hypothetical protein
MRPCGFVAEVFLRSIQAAWRSRVGGVRAVGMLRASSSAKRKFGKSWEKG